MLFAACISENVWGVVCHRCLCPLGKIFMVISFEADLLVVQVQGVDLIGCKERYFRYFLDISKNT
jgi:hypothetical protein